MPNTYSRIIAGAMNWGEWGKNFSNMQFQQMMNHCLEEGIHTFDHADIYGGYTTEAQFGNALKASDIKREEFQLISKCGIQYEAINRDNKVKHYDLSKDYIIWSVENSLKLLKTEYLDLLLLHRPSPLMHPDEISEAKEHLIDQGKVRDFGVSNFTVSQMQLMQSKLDLAVNQIEFSLTHFQPMLDGSLDQMVITGILPMAWSPLGTVFKEDNDQSRRIHKVLNQLKDKYNATEDQLLLAWILKHPSNIHPVVGTGIKKRISDSAKSIRIDLELEDWFSMLVASQGHKVP